MKPYIVSTTNTTATIEAKSFAEALEFARNYFGDYRTDYRNHNRVTHTGTETLGDSTFYVFTISSK